MSFFKKIFSAFTRAERAWFLALLVIAIASVIVLTSVNIVQSTTAVPAQGGSFTEGMVGQPEYVNPVTAQSETDLSLVKLIYSNIYDIADSVTSSTDGKTWTVRLKEGLTWQDGEQLTSDDVVFTVQSIQNPDADSPLASAWQNVSVSRESELEIVFSLANPDVLFGDTLQNLYIAPKHIFADVPPGNWRLSDYILKPVGSGPYEFDSYDQESDGFIADYHLSAWSGFSGTAPLVQNFNFEFYPNEGDLVTAFNDGQVDGFAPTLDDLADITRPHDTYSWRAPDYYAVFFNQSNAAPLQDPFVREALSESVDRDALVSNILGGNGVSDYGPIPPGAPYFSQIITTSSLDTASTTLTADGWMVGSDGIRSAVIQNVSTTLAFTLTVPDIDFLVNTADALQSAWRSIGIDVTIATDTPQNIATNEVPNRNYEALLFGNVLGPSSNLYSFWDSAERFAPGLNLAIYSDPEVDNLIAEIPQTLGDATRTAMFATLESDIVGANPAVFLYSTNDLYVTDNSVRGVETNFLIDPSDRFLEVPSWYLDTTRVAK